MIIALVGLTVVDIPFLTVMGLAAAGTVAIAVLIAHHAAPALLGFAGERLARVNRVLATRPRAPRARGRRDDRSAVRWARFVTAARSPCWRSGRAAGRDRAARRCT